MAALTLAALGAALDRSLLHVFVAGPGYGEGIAIALPEQGWLLLDGCETRDGALPLMAILEQWRQPDEPINAVLLTHPHADHAYGLRDLLETTAPARIGLTTVPADPERVFRAFGVTPPAPAATREPRLAGRVLEGMLALWRRFDAAPEMLIALVDGAAIPLSTPSVRAHVRAPDLAIVEAHLSSSAPEDSNELSAVIELVFGATRIVLGSDLPTMSPSGRELPGGWGSVMTRHPALGAHAGLKIPHHGSPAAFHAALMTAGAGRAWWISPFNRGKRLPPTSPEGVPRLVSLNGEVALTATPRRRDQQPRHADPGVVTLAELPALFTPPASTVAGALLVTPPALGPLEPLWCGAFDDRGALRGTWRGERAFTVVP
ncbi:MAG TPA: MBL fold metallo-hydrolase [Kofleriaceae bacterium]|nr:MBL fold metallo-hydrolase [Kofleriaceae bacterium]